ncbi:class I SAM-dependent methyltransferase (plasmid) [Tundrisphaera sp. TA3]|uniref:class I SAM-dependent methyltransferase n=1 Tax=Tundrisphaera sp. TA3 TaxID=3435775 RepID=UPI003EBD4915
MTRTMTAPSARADDLGAFAREFSFRFLGPQERIRPRWLRAAAWCRRFGMTPDLLNTRFPAGSAQARAAIRPLCRIPRMSTPAIGALIHRAVAGMGPGEAFVNVGVWNGFTLLSGMAGNPDRPCIGVDNFSQFGGPKGAFLSRFDRIKSRNHAFHDMDYRAYFATVHRDPIGFYLYDGEHSYQNQLDGLRAAEPFFAPGCVVMVDDTNDPEPRRATEDFIREGRNRYQVIYDATTRENQHPTWWNGVMLFRRTG